MSFKLNFLTMAPLATAAFVAAAAPASAQNEIVVRVERGDLTADVQFPGDRNNWRGTYDRNNVTRLHVYTDDRIRSCRIDETFVRPELTANPRQEFDLDIIDERSSAYDDLGVDFRRLRSTLARDFQIQIDLDYNDIRRCEDHDRGGSGHSGPYSPSGPGDNDGTGPGSAGPGNGGGDNDGPGGPGGGTDGGPSGPGGNGPSGPGRS